MNNNQLLQVSEGDQFSGEFVAKNPDRRLSQANKPYLLFDIQPNQLPITAVAWKDSCKGLRNVFHGKSIGITGRWHVFNGQWQVKCSSIIDLNSEDQKISQAKTRLRAILSWIPESSLRQFVLRIFNDPSIFEKFISVPGSINHHHAYNGGLLVHSVETSWQVFNNQQIPQKERYLGAVIALLHDVGKIWTYSGKTRTELGLYVNHELLSLEVLAPHLKWLDSIDSQLSSAIRYSLTWKKKSYDSIPKLDLIEIVRAADRVSAGSSFI